MAERKKAQKQTDQHAFTIKLPKELYFFLWEKVLKLRKEGKRASLSSIIRELIEEDRKRWQAQGGGGE